MKETLAWAHKYLLRSGEWYIASWTVRPTRREVIADFKKIFTKKNAWRNCRRKGTHKIVKVKIIEIEK